MERRAKERLIGAVIVVAVVVLVVPEFLQGPKPAAPTPSTASAVADSRTYTVDLTVPAATPSAVDAAVHTEGSVRVDPPAPPIPAAAAAPASVPRPAPAAPARASGPVEAAATPVEPVGVWTVQLGSFASQANAEKLSHQVKALGFSPYVSPAGTGTEQRFRVRLGPMADRAAAEHMIEKLKAQGQAASLVPPKP